MSKLTAKQISKKMSGKKQKTAELDKDAILTTEARRIVFDCMMRGFNMKLAAERANLSHKYVRNWVAKSGVHALVRQEKAKIEAKSQEYLHITKESQAKKHQAVYETAMAERKLTAANTAIRSQSELFGLLKDADGVGQGASVMDLLALVGSKALAGAASSGLNSNWKSGETSNGQAHNEAKKVRSEIL